MSSPEPAPIEQEPVDVKSKELVEKEDITVAAPAPDYDRQYPIVAEGSGKTAQNEGAKAKTVHNVSRYSQKFHLEIKLKLEYELGSGFQFELTFGCSRASFANAPGNLGRVIRCSPGVKH